MMTIVVIRCEGSAPMNNSRKSISTGSRIPWVDIRHSRSNWEKRFRKWPWRLGASARTR